MIIAVILDTGSNITTQYPYKRTRRSERDREKKRDLGINIDIRMCQMHILFKVTAVCPLFKLMIKKKNSDLAGYF